MAVPHQQMHMFHPGVMHPLLLKHDLLRSPWHPWSIVTGTLVPTLVFAVVYYCAGFLRYRQPQLAIVIPLILAIAAGAVSGVARSRLRLHYPGRGHFATAVGMWLAIIVAVPCAFDTYRWYSSRYYNYIDMASYTNIDPDLDKGQSYMDAGQVYFKEGTKVLTARAIAYQNQEVFCAAPIVRQDVVATPEVVLDTGGSVDFWAVGTNCCDPNGAEFNCGEIPAPGYTGVQARSAIRMLDDDLRPFYAMAVQEWTAATGLPSKHPLFFHWVVDPLMTVDSFYEQAQARLTNHIVLFAIFALFLTLALLWVLSRLYIW